MIKKLIILLILLHTTIAGFSQTWTILPPVIPNSVRSIDFSDDNHGYVTNSTSNIYKTSDGGLTWIDVSPGFMAGSAAGFKAICTLDSLTAFAGSDANSLIRTYDGGITWDSVVVPIWQTTQIKFINDSVGFAQGTGGFFRTVNRGLSWIQLSSSTRNGGLFFITNNLGFSGGSGDKIYRTTNQGVSWTLLNTQLLQGAQAIYFFNSNHGIAVDGAGYWSTTYNSGGTWTVSSHSANLNQVGIHFINDSVGFKIYSNVTSGFFTSADAGVSWTTLPNGTGGLIDMDFPSSCIGYIGSLSGKVLKYNCLSTGINHEKEDEIISVYPNPVNDFLNVLVEIENESEFVLYDISSRQLMKQLFTGSTTIIIENLAKGIYLYEIRNKNNVLKKGKVLKN